MYSRIAIEQAPLQTYISALIFAPKRSITRNQFEREMPNWIIRLARVREGWSAALQTLEGHWRRVNSVAFSPDGKVVADQGKMAEAEAMYLRALQGYENAVGADHPRTRVIARNLNAL